MLYNGYRLKVHEATWQTAWSKLNSSASPFDTNIERAKYKYKYKFISLSVLVYVSTKNGFATFARHHPTWT